MINDEELEKCLTKAHMRLLEALNLHGSGSEIYINRWKEAVVLNAEIERRKGHDKRTGQPKEDTPSSDFVQLIENGFQSDHAPVEPAPQSPTVRPGYVYGTRIEPEGHKFVGAFLSGKYHGRGTITYVDGGENVGEFKDGKKHGNGSETDPKGNQYVGEFKNGLKHGQGAYTFAGGARYVGEFRDGEKHGRGTETFITGSKYVGEYKYGAKHGQGTHTFANADKYVGEYKDGKPHGQGTYTSAGGHIEGGLWENGKFRGLEKQLQPETSMPRIKLLAAKLSTLTPTKNVKDARRADDEANGRHIKKVTEKRTKDRADTLGGLWVLFIWFGLPFVIFGVDLALGTRGWFSIVVGGAYGLFLIAIFCFGDRCNH